MRTLLLVLVLAAPAVADTKYRRNQPTVEMTVSGRGPTARAVELPPAKPSITAIDVMLAEERAQPVRHEQAEILEQLVRDTPDDDPDKPEMLFRLAEHYAKQQRFWRLKSIDAAIRAQKR